MRGYINLYKEGTKEEIIERYQGYYCGLCKEMGENISQISRLSLTYDGTFLAIFLAGVFGEETDFQKEHCIVHPIKKKNRAFSTDAIRYSTLVSTMLGYYNFLDDVQDNKKIEGCCGLAVTRRGYNLCKEKYKVLVEDVGKNLEDLYQLERSEEPLVDEVINKFGVVLGIVFSSYKGSEEERRILYSFGFNLGRWIYLIDALDDLEEDERKGEFNLILRNSLSVENIEFLLYNYLGEMVLAMDLLDLKTNKDLIENIVFKGMRARMEAILSRKKQEEEHGKSL